MKNNEVKKNIFWESQQVIHGCWRFWNKVKVVKSGRSLSLLSLLPPLSPLNSPVSPVSLHSLSPLSPCVSTPLSPLSPLHSLSPLSPNSPVSPVHKTLQAICNCRAGMVTLTLTPDSRRRPHCRANLWLLLLVLCRALLARPAPCHGKLSVTLPTLPLTLPLLSFAAAQRPLTKLR